MTVYAVSDADTVGEIQDAVSSAYGWPRPGTQGTRGFCLPIPDAPLDAEGNKQRGWTHDEYPILVADDGDCATQVPDADDGDHAADVLAVVKAGLTGLALAAVASAGNLPDKFIT